VGASKEYNAEYYILNRERIKKRTCDYYIENKPARLKQQAAYKIRNADIIRKKSKIERDEIRMSILNYYTKGKMECACCKEKNLGFLTVDHINNDGGVHRKRIRNNLYRHLVKDNFPPGYQILCYNCNSGRDKTPGKICPHQL
jgi:hypothetical protein